MPELQVPVTQLPPKTYPSVSLIYRNGEREGWSLLSVVEAGVESVAITWKKAARLRRDRHYEPGDYFILPTELAGPALEIAKKLEAQRRTATEEGYAAQAADVEQEREAQEWSEALIGDGFESHTEEG
jgi:hypothetical protein